MLVSIIIINYNYGAYLTQAIESALNQSYPNVQVIVIDDGSLDNSTEIIKRYTDRVIPILKENTGHCSCVNLGFEKSHGDVVILLDADDVLFDFAAALHVAHMSNPAVVKSCGYLEVIDANGKSTGRLIPSKLGHSGDYRDLTLGRGLGMYCASYTSGNAWARHFLDKVMPLPDKDPINNTVGPDGYLTSIDVFFGRIETIHQSLGQYRIHGKNNGPISFRFDADHMRKRLQCRYHRIEYAEQVANRLGLHVNVKEFRKINDWKLNLMRHALVLIEEKGISPAFFNFVTSPFQQYRRQFWKPAMLSLLFMLIRVLPRAAALRLARHLLP